MGWFQAWNSLNWTNGLLLMVVVLLWIMLHRLERLCVILAEAARDLGSIQLDVFDWARTHRKGWMDAREAQAWLDVTERARAAEKPPGD